MVHNHNIFFLWWRRCYRLMCSLGQLDHLLHLQQSAVDAKKPQKKPHGHSAHHIEPGGTNKQEQSNTANWVRSWQFQLANQTIISKSMNTSLVAVFIETKNKLCLVLSGYLIIYQFDVFVQWCSFFSFCL